MKRHEFLKFYFIIPRRGMRPYTARIVNGRSSNVLYEKDGFVLYVAGDDELRICAPKRGRLLRRFLRDFSRSEEGLPRTVSFWFTPFR